MNVKQQKQIRAFLINEFGSEDGSALSDKQEKMLVAFDANMKLLNTLFRDRFDVAFLKLEKELKRLYIFSETTAEEEIRVTFLLNGALHTLRELNTVRNIMTLCLPAPLQRL